MRPLFITAQARLTVEFKIVQIGNSLGVRIPAKVLKVFNAGKDDILTGELRGDELVLRHDSKDGVRQVIDLIQQATGLDANKAEDLSKIRELLNEALAEDGKAHGDPASDGGKP
jgi:antitoxin component of MazEF toxin-antitoxin module